MPESPARVAERRVKCVCSRVCKRQTSCADQPVREARGWVQAETHRRRCWEGLRTDSFMFLVRRL